MRTVVTGATGFVGRHLLKRLDRPNVLSRDADRARRALAGFNPNAFSWDPIKEEPPAATFDGVDAVFHLAGDPVVEGRWTAEKSGAFGIAACWERGILSMRCGNWSAGRVCWFLHPRSVGTVRAATRCWMKPRRQRTIFWPMFAWPGNKKLAEPRSSACAWFPFAPAWCSAMAAPCQKCCRRFGLVWAAHWAMESNGCRGFMSMIWPPCICTRRKTRMCRAR